MADNLLVSSRIVSVDIFKDCDCVKFRAQYNAEEDMRFW